MKSAFTELGIDPPRGNKVDNILIRINVVKSGFAENGCLSQLTILGSCQWVEVSIWMNCVTQSETVADADAVSGLLVQLEKCFQEMQGSRLEGASVDFMLQRLRSWQG